jgi:hypothetical protein
VVDPLCTRLGPAMLSLTTSSICLMHLDFGGRTTNF